MNWVLDSTAFIELIRGSEKGAVIKELFKSEEAFLNSLSLYEILINLYPKERPIIENLMEQMTLLNFDSESSEEAAEIQKNLKASGKLINELDVLIAGICKANGTGVITLDKDFEKIKGLDVKLIK